MNTLAEIIASRRSCRKFTDKPLTEEQVKQLKRAALSSPTSKNCKSWQFVFVQDKATIEALSHSKQHGASLVGGAALAIVVYGDPGKTDVWIEDASIAASFLLLQAQELGLGACWVQLRLRGLDDGRTAKQTVGELLGAPEGLEPLCIVAVGHPDEQHRPYTDERLPWEQAHYERF